MLWVLNHFPEWAIHLVLAAGAGIFLASWIASRLPGVAAYTVTIRFAGLALVVVGLIFEGGLIIKKDYDLKEARLKAELAATAAKGAIITVNTVEKLVYRDRVIVAEGARVTEYIDRVAPQIDATCTLSDEFIRAHNEAAKALP